MQTKKQSELGSCIYYGGIGLGSVLIGLAVGFASYYVWYRPAIRTEEIKQVQEKIIPQGKLEKEFTRFNIKNQGLDNDYTILNG
jgi:hypothetical protein